jgi:mono/diheme cytochrome c family protein
VKKGSFVFLMILSGTLLASFVLANETFKFLPDSGRDLLLKVVDDCKKCDDLASLATTKRTSEEWKAYFTQKGVLGGLREKQVKELTAYLAINLPLPEGQVPKNPKKLDFLPKGGKELLMEHCMSCHTVAAPCLVERPEAGWENLLLRGDHISISEKLKKSEAKTLTSYLAINMPIPEEEIPEDLRVPAPRQ